MLISHSLLYIHYRDEIGIALAVHVDFHNIDKLGQAPKEGTRRDSICCLERVDLRSHYCLVALSACRLRLDVRIIGTLQINLQPLSRSGILK